MPVLSRINEEAMRHHYRCDTSICNNADNIVVGEGAEYADIMFVGEAPGEREDQLGRPFVGRSGNLLDQLLEYGDLSRESVYITNIVKARPPENRDPTPEEIEHYLPWLRAQIDAISPKIIIPLGRHALDVLIPSMKVSEVHGVFITYNGQWYYPMYHPSAGLRNPSVKKTLYDDIQKLAWQEVIL